MTHATRPNPGKWVLAWVAAVLFCWIVLALGAWLLIGYVVPTTQ